MPSQDTRSRRKACSRRARAAIALLVSAAAFIAGLTFAPAADAADTRSAGFVVTDTRSAAERAEAGIRFNGLTGYGNGYQPFQERDPATGELLVPVPGTILPGPATGQRFELRFAVFSSERNFGQVNYDLYEPDGETLSGRFSVNMWVERSPFFGIPYRTADCFGVRCSIQYTPGTVYIDVLGR